MDFKTIDYVLICSTTQNFARRMTPMCSLINPLTPNDHCSGHTAPLTSKRCTLYIYSTNTGTENFKHGIDSTFFFSSKCSLFHNSNVFGSCIIHILYTVCANIKKNNSGAKRLSNNVSTDYDNWSGMAAREAPRIWELLADRLYLVLCTLHFISKYSWHTFPVTELPQEGLWGRVVYRICCGERGPLKA